MPSRKSNRIHVTGHEHDIRAFLETVRSEDRLFDFDRIIPMPDILKKTNAGLMIIGGQRASTWVEESGQPPRLPTESEVAQILATGFESRYDWREEHWDTRWNARDIHIDDRGIELGMIAIEFNTAWGAPLQICRKLIDMFPQLQFDWRWQFQANDPYLYMHDYTPEKGESV
jgi:hypothetical protein